jgi:hypothetical protein
MRAELSNSSRKDEGSQRPQSRSKPKGGKPKAASSPTARRRRHLMGVSLPVQCPTTAPGATPKPAGAGAASGLPFRRESSTSVTIGVGQWAISTHSVHNIASVEVIEGRAVAAALSVWVVHTSALSTAPVTNWVMSAP